MPVVMITGGKGAIGSWGLDYTGLGGDGYCILDFFFVPAIFY